MPRIERGGIRELLEDLSAKVDVLSTGGLYYAATEGVRAAPGETLDIGIKLWDRDGEPLSETQVVAVGTYRVQRIRGGVDTTITSATAASKALGRVYCLYTFDATDFQEDDIYYIVFAGVEIDVGEDTESIPTQIVWGSISQEVSDEILDELQSTTYGLEAIKDTVDGVASDLSDVGADAAASLAHLENTSYGLEEVKNDTAEILSELGGESNAPLSDIAFFSHVSDSTSFKNIVSGFGDGVVAGTPISVPGVYGNGIAGNGAGKLRIPATLPPYPYSISFWVKFGTLAGAEPLTQGYVSSSSYWSIARNGVNLQFNWSTSNSNSIPIPFSTGTWYHIVLRLYSTTSYDITVNGVLYGPFTPSPDLPLVTGTGYFLFLGDQWNYTTVAMDEIGIWLRPITDSEITALYQAYGAAQSIDNLWTYEVYSQIANIEGLLENATYGLAALDTDLGVIDGVVDSIQSTVNDIDADVSHPIHGLEAISTDLRSQMASAFVAGSYFETTTDNWTVFGTGYSASRSTTIKSEGSYSLRVSTNTLGVGGISRTFTGLNLNSHLVRCWISVEGSLGVTATLEANGVSKELYVTNDMTSGVVRWAVPAVVAQPDSVGSLTVTISANGYPGVAVFYVDAIEILEIAGAAGSLLMDNVTTLLKVPVSRLGFQAGSLLDILNKDTNFTFSRDTDSLEAQRDRIDSFFAGRSIWRGYLESEGEIELTTNYQDLISYTAPAGGALVRDVTLMTRGVAIAGNVQMTLTVGANTYVGGELGIAPASTRAYTLGLEGFDSPSSLTLPGDAILTVRAKKVGTDSAYARAICSVWEPEILPS